jgi:transcriptional regulator with XRE-family HTH domain
LKQKIPIITVLSFEMNESRDKHRLILIGQRIRSVRERHGLSQDYIAEACDVTKGNLSMIENGQKDFYFTTFLEIAKGIGVDPKILLDY